MQQLWVNGASLSTLELLDYALLVLLSLDTL